MGVSTGGVPDARRRMPPRWRCRSPRSRSSPTTPAFRAASWAAG